MSRRQSILGILSGALICVSASHAATINVSTAPTVEAEATVSGTTPIGPSSDLIVYRGSSGESRVVYEWALPALAAGSTITAVNYNGFVSGFQSGGGLYPDISFHGYAGNGVYTAADATVPFNNIGQTGALNVGGLQTYGLSTSYVQSLSASSSPYLGTMLYAEQTNLEGNLIKSGTYIGVPNLQVIATVPDFGTVSAKPLFDESAASTDNVHFVLNDGATGIVTQYSPSFNTDERGLMGYDLSGVPHGATITGATLTLNLFDLTYSSSGLGYPNLRVYGSAGDLAGLASDATNLLNVLGTSSPVSALGVLTLNLNPSQIQSLLATNSLLDVTALGSPDGNQIGFYTTEESLAQAPTLNISYSVPVPEPTCAGLVVGAMCLIRRRRTLAKKR